MNGLDDRWLLAPMVEIVLSLQAQSDWTWRHLGRVARYAVVFGRRLGLGAEALLALHCGAMLHDIGKLVVPNEILDKASPLDRDEWYAITKHSMVSAQMLKAQAIPLSVVRVAQSHHEWYDGSGYPMGLAGDAIPVGARVLSLADSLDAMSSDRPYRQALSAAEIVAEIDKGASTQFDPRLVSLLRPLIETGLEDVVPRRTLQVLSDDPALFRELWFASYPWGWDLVPWTAGLTDAFPPELQAGTEDTATGAVIDLTVVDCRAAYKLPVGALEEIEGPVLWVDPVDRQGPAVHRPLDLQSLLSALQPADNWRFGQSKDATRVKVLVADPFKLFRQALARYLSDQEDVQLVGVVDSPSAYRVAVGGGEIDVAVVASDFVEGTRTSRELQPGDKLIANEDGLSGRPDVVPSVVLVADEDLTDSTKMSGVSPGVLWEPGRPVEAQRVYISRGAPAETLIAAIKAVVESSPNAREAYELAPQPPGSHARDTQVGLWS
ncbi:MAG TPA: HD domain-containing phosphohydrolase [Chloroflexia bacterium]